MGISCIIFDSIIESKMQLDNYNSYPYLFKFNTPKDITKNCIGISCIISCTCLILYIMILDDITETSGPFDVNVSNLGRPS